ncbi:MAG: hypothetical protein JW866_02160 [Ignavibacteriales bacterium]|nr:hypothetical protein [Ignavibacteriales bacterium]
MNNIIKLLSIILIFNNLVAQLTSKTYSYRELLYNNKNQEAIILIKKEIQNNRKDYILYYDCGNAYKSIFKFDSAIVYLENACNLNFDNIEILQSLAYSYAVTGMYEDAINIYNKILLLDENNIIAINKLASLYIELNNYKLANDLYIKLIEKDPENFFYYKQSGFCYLKMDCADDAIRMYAIAYERNKKDIEIILRFGKLIFSKKNLDAGYQLLRTGYELYPKNVPINSLLADICFEKKDYLETIVHLDRSISGGDSSASAYQKLGVTYYMLANSSFVNNITEEEKKLNNALSAFEKSFQKDSNNALTVLYLGTTYKGLKNYVKAIYYLNKALKLMISDYIGDTYIHLGSAYELSENFKEAIDAYSNSLKYNPNSINVYFYIAGIYDKNYQNRKTAIEFYEQFLKVSNKQNPIMEKFASERVQKLREEMHFRGELK